MNFGISKVFNKALDKIKQYQVTPLGWIITAVVSVSLFIDYGIIGLLWSVVFFFAFFIFALFYKELNKTFEQSNTQIEKENIAQKYEYEEYPNW